MPRKLQSRPSQTKEQENAWKMPLQRLLGRQQRYFPGGRCQGTTKSLHMSNFLSRSTLLQFRALELKHYIMLQVHLHPLLTWLEKFIRLVKRLLSMHESFNLNIFLTNSVSPTSFPMLTSFLCAGSSGRRGSRWIRNSYWYR